MPPSENNFGKRYNRRGPFGSLPLRQATLEKIKNLLSRTGARGGLAPAPPRDNLSQEQEIRGTGFLERTGGLWYDATVLEPTSRSSYWPAT